MNLRALLIVLCAMACSEVAANAKSSSVTRDHPWSPHHIDDLPADIRHYIGTVCGGPARAQHDFATYLPQEKRWRINLEYLQCNGLGEYRRGNECLDVDFVARGQRFRLVRKEYRACGF
jgi:hypothetical protein